MADHDTHDHTGVPGVATGAVASDGIWDAKGDLAGGTGANTAAKLTVGANDTILMADAGQTTGLKWVASQTPSTQAFGDAAAEGTADTYSRGDHKHAMPTVSASTGDSSADVTLTGDTIADATGASLSLAAGTWVLLAQVIFQAGTATFDYTLAAITDSSNVVVGETRGLVANNGPATIPVFAVVSPGSTTTYKVRGQSGRTGNKILRYSSGTQIGTRLVAIRVA